MVMETNQFIHSKAGSRINDTDNGSSSAGGDLMTKVGYLVAISLAIVVGNVLVIASIVTVKGKLRITNYFLVSLATADLMVGTVTIPLFTLRLLQHEAFAYTGFCYAVLLSSLFITLASQLNVVAVTVERYLAVCHSLLHRRMVTSKPSAVRWSVSFVWVVSAVCAALSSLAVEVNRDRDGRCSYYSYFHQTFLIASVMAGILVPFVVILCLNVRIVKQVRLSALFTQSMQQPATGRRQSTSLWGGVTGGVVSKATKTVVVVCCMYLLAWTPFFAVVVAHTADPNLSPHAALHLVLLIAFTNSASNPIVYALCNINFCRVSCRVQHRLLAAMDRSCCRATMGRRSTGFCCCCYIRSVDDARPRLASAVSRKDSMCLPLRWQSVVDKQKPSSERCRPVVGFERSQL